MEIISNLSDIIEEELHDAEKYIRCAIDKKEAHPNLSAAFYKLSVDEMNHVMLLHDQVAALITEYRREHGEPPEKMQGVYEYLHRKHTEKANEIKVMQGIYGK